MRFVFLGYLIAEQTRIAKIYWDVCNKERVYKKN